MHTLHANTMPFSIRDLSILRFGICRGVLEPVALGCGGMTELIEHSLFARNCPRSWRRRGKQNRSDSSCQEAYILVEERGDEQMRQSRNDFTSDRGRCKEGNTTKTCDSDTVGAMNLL